MTSKLTGNQGFFFGNLARRSCNTKKEEFATSAKMR